MEESKKKETTPKTEKSATNKTATKKASKRPLDVTTTKEVSDKITDLKVIGEDFWVCISKASSEVSQFMKSTKVATAGSGLLVQVTTKENGQIAEALTYVPDAILIKNKKSGNYRISTEDEFKGMKHSHSKV